MNRFINVRFIRHLTKTALNKSSNRQFSYVKKYNPPDVTKNSFFISWKNYCTTTNYDLEDSGLMNKTLFEKITQNNPDLEKKIKLSLMEIESIKADGNLAPVKMNEREWKEYLALTSYRARCNYLKFLAKNEFSDANLKARKKKKAEKYQAMLKELNLPEHIEYGVGRNAYFMVINKKSIMTLMNMKIFTAELFKNEVIFDLGYEKYMSQRQLKETAKQLLLTFAGNRLHENPYHIHLCNYPVDTYLSETMNRFFSDDLNNFPLTRHEESYLDVFDKDRLVYLTPDSPNTLVYDPNDIYIIGAFVDTGPSLPISFAKGKADKIRTAKFPLDKYLTWKQGKKSLPLDIVLKILLDLQHHRDWTKALKHIPRRLIESPDDWNKYETDESNEANETNARKDVRNTSDRNNFDENKKSRQRHREENSPYCLKVPGSKKI